MRCLISLILMILSLAPLAAQNPPIQEEAIPITPIEKKPTFQGADANTFAKWVSQNKKYPEAAKAAGIEGRVMVQFTVGKDGVVRDVKVLRGVDEALDAEAVRVISSSPKWGPAEKSGKIIDFTYQLPVIFRLDEQDDTSKKK